jgi:hypothetical protein
MMNLMTECIFMTETVNMGFWIDKTIDSSQI